MINVEKFQAKLVADPEQRETRRGPVCNMRIRQIDPGKASVFIDLAAFGKDFAEACAGLVKGTVIEVSDAGLVYNEWEVQPKDGGKPFKRSKHGLIVQDLAVVGAS